jgi:hypothetical protein
MKKVMEMIESSSFLSSAILDDLKEKEVEKEKYLIQIDNIIFITQSYK